MAILSYDTRTGQVSGVCAHCKKDWRIERAALVLGVASEEGSNMLELPACLCGSREFLVRTFDSLPQSDHGSGFDLRRRLVNQLGADLVKAGQLHTLHKAALSAKDAPTSLDMPTPAMLAKGPVLSAPPP